MQQSPISGSTPAIVDVTPMEDIATLIGGDVAPTEDIGIVLGTETTMKDSATVLSADVRPLTDIAVFLGNVTPTKDYATVLSADVGPVTDIATLIGSDDLPTNDSAILLSDDVGASDPAVLLPDPATEANPDLLKGESVDSADPSDERYISVPRTVSTMAKTAAGAVGAVLFGSSASSCSASAVKMIKCNIAGCRRICNPFDRESVEEFVIHAQNDHGDQCYICTFRTCLATFKVKDKSKAIKHGMDKGHGKPLLAREFYNREFKN